MGIMPSGEVQKAIKEVVAGECGYITMVLEERQTVVNNDGYMILVHPHKYRGEKGAKWKEVVDLCSKHENECFYLIWNSGAKEGAEEGKCVFVDWVPLDCVYEEDPLKYKHNGPGLRHHIEKQMELYIAKHLQIEEADDMDEEPKFP